MNYIRYHKTYVIQMHLIQRKNIHAQPGSSGTLSQTRVPRSLQRLSEVHVSLRRVIYQDPQSDLFGVLSSDL